MATLTWSLHLPSLAVWQHQPLTWGDGLGGPINQFPPPQSPVWGSAVTVTSGWPGPEVSEPRPAIISASSAHLSFCSLIRHRPVSAQISTWEE